MSKARLLRWIIKNRSQFPLTSGQYRPQTSDVFHHARLTVELCHLRRRRAGGLEFVLTIDDFLGAHQGRGRAACESSPHRAFTERNSLALARLLSRIILSALLIASDNLEDELARINRADRGFGGICGNSAECRWG
jgi:hypothetical protein